MQSKHSPFRTRLLERTRETDSTRFGQVRAALERASADVETECTGLARRVAEYYQQADFALDDAGSFEERTVEEERRISQSEAMAAAGEARMAAVRTHAEAFARMLAQLDALETTR